MENCPECNKEFNSEHSLSTHYSMVHGKPEVNCENCGQTFNVGLSKINKRKFCSIDCSTESSKRRIFVDCDNCGESFDVVKSRYDRQEKFFCSDECYSLGIGVGDNIHYNNGAKVSVNCYNCNDEMEVIPSREERYDRTFCSIECRNKSFSGKGNPFYGKSHSEKMKEVMPSGENHWAYGTELSEETKRKISESHTGKGNPMYGEDGKDAPMFGVKGKEHPSWKGGENRENGYYYYKWRSSSKWKKARKEALERDGFECIDCGKEKDLHVHHKKPVSKGGEKYLLDNLVTLCKKHHYDRHRA